jgi:phosphoglycolate phosphatase
MTHPVEAVVFDLDGTLVDSCADITVAANHALQQHGFLTHSEQQIAAFVGDGAKHLIVRAAGVGEEDPRVPALVESFISYYAAHATSRTTPMPGALEALLALAGLPLAVVTNKPRGPTLALLEHLGLLGRFAVVVAGGDLPYLKPDPLPLLHVADRLALPVRNLVIVGDSPQDIECGKRADARTIGVRGGIAAPERLMASNPDYLLDSLFELPAVIAQCNGTTVGN